MNQTSSSSCTDCGLWVQGGDEGWRAHRHYVHGEGARPVVGDGYVPSLPYSEERAAERRRRRMAAARETRKERRASR